MSVDPRKIELPAKDEYYERCMHLATLNRTLRKSWKKQKKKNKKLKKKIEELKKVNENLQQIVNTKSDNVAYDEEEYTIDISFSYHDDEDVIVSLRRGRVEGIICLSIIEQDGTEYFIPYEDFKIQHIRDIINRPGLMGESILLTSGIICNNQKYRTFVHVTRVINKIFRFVIELENMNSGKSMYINILPGLDDVQERFLDYMEGKLPDEFYKDDSGIHFYNFNELAKKGENNEI